MSGASVDAIATLAGAAPTTGVAGVELIDSLEGFRACAANWDALYRRDAEASWFLSRRWLEDLYARRPGVCTLAWRDSAGELPYGAFLPLRRRVRLDRRRRRFDNVICAAGNDWADHTGALCLPGREEEALPALGEALAALPCRRLLLDSLRISEARLALLLAPFERSGYERLARSHHDNDGGTSLDVSPCVTLPETFERWLEEGVRANTRQRVRRLRRRLAADPELRVRDSDADTRAQDLARFRELWIARWARAKGDSVGLRADKYLRIIEDGLRGGDLRLTALLERERPIALSATYLDPLRRTVLFFVGARDPAFGRLPAGLALHAHAIERAIAEGYRRYDLLRGDEPYKYSLGARDVPLISLELRAPRLDPDDVFLHESCVDEALAAIGRAERTARCPTIERLYGQLLESWPDEPRVLGRYADWLLRAGEIDAARAIERALDTPR